MSEENINLAAPIHAATKLGKAVAAREVFMDGDKETVQQIGDKTHQLENAIKDITATGGASTANAVSYSNETSGMTAVTAQGAIDELVTKNKSQDTIIAAKAEKSDVQAAVSELKDKDSALSAEIAKKANSADVSIQMQTEQTRVNDELAKKFNSENIIQESGEAEDKVMSQKAVSTKLSDLSYTLDLSLMKALNVESSTIVNGYINHRLEFVESNDFVTYKNVEKLKAGDVVILKTKYQNFTTPMALAIENDDSSFDSLFPTYTNNLKSGEYTSTDVVTIGISPRDGMLCLSGKKNLNIQYSVLKPESNNVFRKILNEIVDTKNFMGYITPSLVLPKFYKNTFYITNVSGEYPNLGITLSGGVLYAVCYINKAWSYFVLQKKENIGFESYGIASKNLFNKYNLAYGGNSVYIKPDTGLISFSSNDINKVSHLIYVKSKDKITLSSSSVFNEVFGYRFFNVNLEIVSFGTIGSSNKLTLSVPAGAVYFQFSFLSSYKNLQVEYGDTATEYQEYQSEYEQKISNVISSLNDKIIDSKTIKLPYLKVNAVSMSKGNSLEISDTPNLKTWHTIGFMADITTFGKIKISHGTNNYTGGIVEIDETNIYTYNATKKDEINTIPHNLTIKDYVVINIKVEDTIQMASLTIGTNGGMVKKDIPWGGCRYNVIAEEESTGVYRNAILTIGGVGLRKDIWVFGDSYTDTWTVPMKQKYNYGNFMIDGYSGRNSSYAYTSLLNCLKIGKPKIIVWMMGMNDPDNSDSVNVSWKDSFDKAIDICKQNGIIFIPCTIPNVPDRIMKYKNNIIERSKLQYIDVATYLGASNIGSSWYEGLLSSDNVHPSNLGSTKIAELLFTELSLMQG